MNLDKLPSITLLDKERLPITSGIYFVCIESGELIYIGRTTNLSKRWKNHHRFPQLKRMNRKTPIVIKWLEVKGSMAELVNLEMELIKKHNPPLNWTRVIKPIRKITPTEIALQQSLKQLVKFNTVILGFDPFAEDNEPPTIFLLYPVLGRRGCSGGIRTALRAINKKASSLKWKEYKTRPKSGGGFGYWETYINNIKIDLMPFECLVHFMKDTVTQKIAGVEMMALNSRQVQLILGEEDDPDDDNYNWIDPFVVDLIQVGNDAPV